MSDKRFGQLSADYEREQAELEAESTALQAEVDAYAADSFRADRFIEIFRRHTEFEELSASYLNEFIGRILVYEADKSSGERVQEVEIIFNFIGRFEPPSEPTAPLTAEELANEEKQRAKLAKQREANRRWYAKKKAAQTTE